VFLSRMKTIVEMRRIETLASGVLNSLCKSG